MKEVMMLLMGMKNLMEGIVYPMIRNWELHLLLLIQEVMKCILVLFEIGLVVV
jgi:hypothetical protein